MLLQHQVFCVLLSISRLFKDANQERNNGCAIHKCSARGEGVYPFGGKSFDRGGRLEVR